MQTIANRFRTKIRIGKGAFGEIYSGENITTRQKVAIKLESKSKQSSQLLYESKIYRCLNAGHGIPMIYYSGEVEGYYVLVMDLLGNSIGHYFEQQKHRFSLKTVLMIADQLLTTVEFIHKKGFIHRDIKPENLVMGLDRNQNVIYFIDFGLAALYKDLTNGKHIKFAENKSLIGTARYCSINTHLGYEQSRRDDLESIGYVLLYLLRGNLPWQGLRLHKQDKYTEIAKVKMQTPIEELCKGLPREFSTFLTQVRSLQFEDEPDYAFYRQLFRNLMIREEYFYDDFFDWTVTPIGRSQSLHQCLPSKDENHPKKLIELKKVIAKPNLGRRRTSVSSFSDMNFGNK